MRKGNEKGAWVLAALELAKSNPLFWVGVAFVFASILGSATSSGLKFEGATRAPILIAGFACLAAGSVLLLRDTRRQVTEKRFDDPVCYDVAFWHKVFDKLPPTFIKLCTVDEENNLQGDAKQIAENQPLIDSQGGYKTGDLTNTQWELIKDDHRFGDQQAVSAECSRQLESHATYGLNPERQILTIKEKLEHAGDTYIVGWYVPIELPDHLHENQEPVRIVTRQVVLGLVAPKGDDDGGFVHVGKAAFRAAKSGKRGKVAHHEDGVVVQVDDPQSVASTGS